MSSRDQKLSHGILLQALAQGCNPLIPTADHVQRLEEKTAVDPFAFIGHPGILPGYSVVDGLTRILVPEYAGGSLGGYSHGGYILRSHLCALESLPGYFYALFIDVKGILLCPTRLWEYLPQL